MSSQPTVVVGHAYYMGYVKNVGLSQPKGQLEPLNTSRTRLQWGLLGCNYNKLQVERVV